MPKTTTVPQCSDKQDSTRECGIKCKQEINYYISDSHELSQRRTTLNFLVHTVDNFYLEKENYENEKRLLEIRQRSLEYI